MTPPWIDQLTKYGQIAANRLRRSLTDDQIEHYLDIINSSPTIGTARQVIVDEGGLQVELYNVLCSFARIEALRESAMDPNPDPVAFSQALDVAFFALHAGIGLGATLEGEDRAALLKFAVHGEKFQGHGRKPDALSRLLEEILRDSFCKHGNFPTWKDVVDILEGMAGGDVVDEVEWFDDESGQIWCKRKSKPTSFSALQDRLTKTKEKIRTESK